MIPIANKEKTCLNCTNAKYEKVLGKYKYNNKIGFIGEGIYCSIDNRFRKAFPIGRNNIYEKAQIYSELKEKAKKCSFYERLSRNI